MTRILRAVSAAITLLLPAVAAAQDTPRIGLVMGYPAQVGVLWTVAARLAIRPEVNWTRTTTETVSTATVFNGTGVTTTSVTTTSHSNAIGTGVTALLYLTQRDALRTYLAPRYSYAHTTTSTDLSSPLANVVPAPTEASTSTHAVSGSIGAQYSVARHFGIFGELGLQYSHNAISPSSSVLRTDAKQTAIGLRSGAGVIVFFGA
jgi:hypothetical protein